jgi:hypothetical protein
MDALHRRAPEQKAAPSRRDVPFTVRVRLLLGGLAAYAWSALALMTVVAGPFLVRSDLFTPLVGDVEFAKGVVLGCRATGSSTGGSEHHSGRAIEAIRYRFDVEGRRYEGVSFDTWCPAPGSEWNVRYAVRDPAISRLSGMRRNVFGPEVAIVVVFPLAALIAVVLTFRRGLGHVRLLRDRDPAFWRDLPFHPCLDAAGVIQPAIRHRSLLLLVPPALVAVALGIVVWTAPDRGAARLVAGPAAPPAALEVERDDAAAR